MKYSMYISLKQDPAVKIGYICGYESVMNEKRFGGNCLPCGSHGKVFSFHNSYMKTSQNK
jgi:hypothetical protein